MEKVLHKARNHRAAERWDIKQQITMTPEQRQQAAKELKKRFYGLKQRDVRGKKL